ncbi:MAG TPA: nucleotide exchange factor GrpE [Candidatus Limnocylindria bacterium]|jgi:molecular chaperone GrpE|nr:nucleotide exchange factor GrpE [Candidatus Limnocylindria bacterium]
MDDKARKAEELLQERLRTRTNGETHGETAGAVVDAEPEAPATPAKMEELTNDLKRMTADFANYRKRNEAERTEFAKFAKADLIARLLDVLDGYDRALATVPDEVKGQPWVEGMWLVERKLRSILDAEGLEPIDSLGKPFDPYMHEAVAHVESDKAEGTVIEEHQKAYRLHDRVIRPALVTVAKKKE